MTIEEQFRAPHEIISDLLGLVAKNESYYDDHWPRIQVLQAEAQAYVERVERDKQAWKNIRELHKTCTSDQSGVRWDAGL